MLDFRLMPTADPRSDRIDSMLAFIHGLQPGRDLTTKAVAWRLRRVAHHLDTEIRRRLAAEGMELWEIEILCALLRREGTLTMGELLDIAQLTSGAITNRIARLEQEGYVRRDVDPGDRRQVLVSLTPKGHDRAWEVIEANNTAEQAIFAGIDPDLQRRLSADLRELLLATEGADPAA